MTDIFIYFVFIKLAISRYKFYITCILDCWYNERSTPGVIADDESDGGYFGLASDEVPAADRYPPQNKDPREDRDPPEDRDLPGDRDPPEYRDITEDRCPTEDRGSSEDRDPTEARGPTPVTGPTKDGSFLSLSRRCKYNMFDR